MQYIRNLLFTKHSRLGIAAIAVLFMCGQSLGAIHIHADHLQAPNSLEHNDHGTESVVHDEKHEAEHNDHDTDCGGHDIEYNDEHVCLECIQADKTPSVIAPQAEFLVAFDSDSISSNYRYQANKNFHFLAFKSRAPPTDQ